MVRELGQHRVSVSNSEPWSVSGQAMARHGWNGVSASNKERVHNWLEIRVGDGERT